MDEKRREEIHKQIDETEGAHSRLDADIVIDLTEKATAEEIFKAIEESHIRNRMYDSEWKELKKKFGIGSEQDARVCGEIGLHPNTDLSATGSPSEKQVTKKRGVD